MHLGQEGMDFGFMRILFVENPGMAFGQVLPGAYGKIILSVLRLVAISGIGYYISKLIKEKAKTGLLIAVSCIFAGAVGNLLDSAFYGLMFSESYYSSINGVAEFMSQNGGYETFLYGHVVDMLQFTVRFPEWFPWWGGNEIFPPIFNIADTAITVGVLMILIWQKRYFKAKDKSIPAVVSGNNSITTQQDEQAFSEE
jgi:signal peptidase II